MKLKINLFQKKKILKQEQKIEEKLDQLENQNLIIPTYARTDAYDFLKKQTDNTGMITNLDSHLNFIEHKYKTHYHLIGKRTKDNLTNRINPHLQNIYDDCLNMDFYLEFKMSEKKPKYNLEPLKNISEKKEIYKEWVKNYSLLNQKVQKEIPALESLCQTNSKLVDLIDLNINRIEHSLENYLGLLKKAEKTKFN